MQTRVSYVWPVALPMSYGSNTMVIFAVILLILNYGLLIVTLYEKGAPGVRLHCPTDHLHNDTLHL